MMSDELIYRNMLKEHIGSYAGMFTDELGFVVSLEAVLRGIDFAEAVDAAEVVHGEWIIPTKIGHRSFNIPHCSACGGVPCGVDENTKFCPNCGADMRERRNDV